ncbi:MAG: hypothetical protein WA021_01545 [Minisyncoccia bacterium]
MKRDRKRSPSGRRAFEEMPTTAQRGNRILAHLESASVREGYALSLEVMHRLLLPAGHPDALYEQLEDGSFAQLSAKYTGCNFRSLAE